MPTTGNGAVQSGLGGSAGYGELAVPRGDDDSIQVDVSSIFSGGLNFLGQSRAADSLFVNTNGSLSFGAALSEYPTLGGSLPDLPVIAPFWADIDTRLDGEGSESGEIWVDLDQPSGTVTITWADVGSYRYGADATNLFQMQLVDRGGGDFDIVLRYERVDWTTGSASDDGGAVAYIGAPQLPQPIMIGSDMAQIDDLNGNTGEAGYWVFEVRGGGIGGSQPVSGLALTGTAGDDVLEGSELADILRGLKGNDILRGYGGADWLFGGDGQDTINGGDGDDIVFGGATEADLRDVVYGGNGNDVIDAGYGNDLVYGGAGNDSVIGGFGADELFGQDDDDTLSGGPLSDMLNGGNANDFLNGGFGHDRLNGGAGADRFYHQGIADHGSDWIQDYDWAAGDVLVWGGVTTSASQFQVNYADTAGAGVLGVSEAFVIYKPTGQIIWALVDGGTQTSLMLRLSGTDYDLLG